MVTRITGIQTNNVHRLKTDKECLESFLPGIGKISAIPADSDKPGCNGDSNNYSNWTSKDACFLQEQEGGKFISKWMSQ